MIVGVAGGVGILVDEGGSMGEAMDRWSSTTLLAYVFWHWPPVSADASNYEADLVAFHASLVCAPPAGFLHSATFQVAGAPWLPQHRDCYEDWYVIRDWAAVGTLNTNAVAPAHTKSHDRVARQAESGASGLYALRAGDEVPGGTAATWFTKPAGWSYADLESALQACLDRGLTLWQRQMLLSPAPEFCLRGDAAPGLAASLHGSRVTYRALR
ncbi:MAG TPA: hypothetical protein VF734_13290 [Pseudonocardiaceae bacterium]